jgi:hypothetical protein
MDSLKERMAVAPEGEEGAEEKKICMDEIDTL